MSARLVFAAAWFACEDRPVDRDAILTWLVCEECVDEEREQVRAIGQDAVPVLAGFLDRLPPELSDSLALQLGRRWTADLYPDSAAYVRMYVENAQALARARAAQALGDLRAVTELQVALDTAVTRSYRPDIIRAIRGALAAAAAGGPQVAIVRVEPATLELPRGVTARLSVFLEDQDSNSVVSRVLWRSSDSSIATVDSGGRVTGLAMGRVVVSASVSEGAADSAQVTVLATAPPRYSLRIVSGSNQSTPAGEPLPAPVRVRLSDARGAPLPSVRVTWSVLLGAGGVVPESQRPEERRGPSRSLTLPTDEEGEVAVGWVLGPQPGLQVLQARAEGAPAINIRARATQPSGPPITLELSPDSITLAVGDAARLNVAVLGGADASPRAVSFTSSDPAVATVNRVGHVTAIAPGRAWITARAIADSTAADVTLVIVPIQDAHGTAANRHNPAISRPIPAAAEAD